MPSRLVNRNITADRGRTSMRLEPELWAALHDICGREQITLGELVRQIERRGHPGGRTSAVRVHIVEYFRTLATELGHGANGNGAQAGADGGGAARLAPPPRGDTQAAGVSAAGPAE